MYVYGQLTAKTVTKEKNPNVSNQCQVRLTTKTTENRHCCDANDSNTTDTLFDTKKFVSI